jgi:hypothetical protein
MKKNHRAASIEICKQTKVDKDQIDRVARILKTLMDAVSARHTQDVILIGKAASMLGSGDSLGQIARLIDQAKEGGAECPEDEMLRGFASLCLEHNLPMPPNLRDYIIDVLRRPGPLLPIFKERGGRGWRDAAILFAVEQVVCTTNIKATRGEEQRRKESACSLVAKALKEANAGIDESSVVKIWQARCNQLKRDYGPKWLEHLREEHEERNALVRNALEK